MRDSTAPGGFTHRLRYLLILGILAKLLVDTTVQIYNPFLTIIAAGAGVGVVTMGRLVSIRSLMGFSAPFFGALADRIGYRMLMRLGLLTVGAGMILAGLSNGVLVLGIGMALTGIGQMAFTPNLHAYLSGKLPYEKRAMGLGITEYSWALGSIVGLFLAGQLIEWYSWRAPFIVIGVGLIGMALLYGTLPKVTRADAAQRQAVKAASPFHTPPPRGTGASSTWACILTQGIIMFAMMHLIIVHGAWLQEAYGLSAAGLGTVALVFGFVDLSASLSVSLLVDRIGKRRSVLIGVIGMIGGFALLPFLNTSLAVAVAGIAIPRLFFEFAIVSMFPLLSEQAPSQRGKVMSFGMTSMLLGTTAAGLTGPAAFLAYGVWGITPVSLGLSILALILVLSLVKEHPHATTSSG